MFELDGRAAGIAGSDGRVAGSDVDESEAAAGSTHFVTMRR
jgi:hypothetical protein